MGPNVKDQDQTKGRRAGVFSDVCAANYLVHDYLAHQLCVPSARHANSSPDQTAVPFLDAEDTSFMRLPEAHWPSGPQIRYADVPILVPRIQEPVLRIE